MSFTPFDFTAADLIFLQNDWPDAQDAPLAPWNMGYDANFDLGLSVNAWFHDREVQRTDLTTPAPLMAAAEATHWITQIGKPLTAPTGSDEHKRNAGLFAASEPDPHLQSAASTPATLLAPCAICKTLPKNESDAK